MKHTEQRGYPLYWLLLLILIILAGVVLLHGSEPNHRDWTLPATNMLLLRPR